MIPMCDNFNHSDVTVINEIVTKSLHIDPDQESNYFTRAKFKNNYSAIWTEEEISNMTEEQKLNVHGRFNRENFEANQKEYYDISRWREHLANGVKVWEVPYIFDRHDEDNDTDDEESSEDEEEKVGSMVNVLQDLLKGR